MKIQTLKFATGGIYFLLASLVAGALFLNCAAPRKIQSSDPSLPEIDVLQLKENSDEALKLSQENKLELQTLSAKVHELETRISTLGDEVGTMPIGKIDEHTSQISLLTEQLRILEEKLAARPVVIAAGPPKKKELETFSPTTLDTSKTPLTPPTFKPDSLIPPTTLTKSKGAKAHTAAKSAPRKPPNSDAEAQLYKKAFDLYYARDYEHAILKFEELLQKYPASTYADNCHYWIGECQFALGNFSKAITSFRNVLVITETEKADDSQLKLGYCFLRLGDRKQAAVEFKKVVSLYADSEYTERAKEELAKLE